MVIAGDQRRDVARDDLGERAVTIGARGPVPHTFADVHPSEMGQVVHVDMCRQLAVLLCLREQLAEHVGVRIVHWFTGEDAMLVAVALQDRLDDQIAGIARH